MAKDKKLNTSSHLNNNMLNNSPLKNFNKYYLRFYKYFCCNMLKSIHHYKLIQCTTN